MSIVLVTGDDPVLVGEAVTRTVDALVGDGDASLMLETLTERSYVDDNGDHDPARLVDAARTPPFLTERRVVVARHLSRFSTKAACAPIVEMLGDMLDTTDLVLVWEKGVEPSVTKMPSLPKALREAVETAGGSVTATAVGRGKDAANWLHDRLGSSSLRFDRAAIAAVDDLLGEDRSRVVGLLRTLEGALGAGAEVTADDVALYGGSERGGVAPWDLDDAIDRGDVAGALAVLARIIPHNGTPSDRNSAAFRLIGALHRRYANMLRLDGAGVASDKEAAALLGMKGSTFPAKKARQQSRTLGFDRLTRAVELLAEADLQLRGTVDWPPELVMEVLVARLANLSPR